MFKVAFPWATVKEEDAEKKHLKSIPEAGREEIAGNVWVPPAKGTPRSLSLSLSLSPRAYAYVIDPTNPSQRLSSPKITACAIG